MTTLRQINLDMQPINFTLNAMRKVRFSAQRQRLW